MSWRASASGQSAWLTFDLDFVSFVRSSFPHPSQCGLCRGGLRLQVNRHGSLRFPYSRSIFDSVFTHCGLCRGGLRLQVNRHGSLRFSYSRSISISTFDLRFRMFTPSVGYAVAGLGFRSIGIAHFEIPLSVVRSSLLCSPTVGCAVAGLRTCLLYTSPSPRD